MPTCVCVLETEKKIAIDPESLGLPDPRDLKPFPNALVERLLVTGGGGADVQGRPVACCFRVLS